MKNFMRIITFFSLIFLIGCATPLTTLRNDRTGEVVTCGGGKNGSIVLGMVGYSMEKNKDEDCVRYYQSAGYRVIERDGYRVAN